MWGLVAHRVIPAACLMVAAPFLVSAAAEWKEICIADYCYWAEVQENPGSIVVPGFEVDDTPGSADDTPTTPISTATPDEIARQQELDDFFRNRQDDLCTDNLSPIACGTTPPDPAAPVVTYPTTIYASDLVSFLPDAPSVSGEPDNIGLIGKPTNIVASSAEHMQGGTLFGYPVFVDFTPASYTFDYGDGTMIDSATGGASWASQGLPQFSDAPTAHAYAARGSYTATVTTHYAAYVAFPDGIWREVVGTVAASSTYPVQIYTAKTALVNDDCLANPSGIGCR